MREPFLCRLGFHYWNLLGYSAFSCSLADTVEECRLCHRRREIFGYGQAKRIESRKQRDFRLRFEREVKP